MTVLLDGAMGTELERLGAGMTAPLWSAHALRSAPELVQRIHREYLQAGAQVIVTNTFRTQRRTLIAAGLSPNEAAVLAPELTQRAVTLALAARAEVALSDPHAARAKVAGSLSPLEDCFAPDRSPTRSTARSEHREIAQQLAEGGCDLLLAETMGRVDEACAAIESTAGLGIPCWLAVTATADGRLLGGETFETLWQNLAGLPIGAMLINCTDLQHLPAALAAMTLAPSRRREVVLGTYPHTGSNRPGQAFVPHAYTAETFAETLARMTASSAWGAQIELIGACCGSTPAWIAALRAHLQPTEDQREKGFDRLAALTARIPPT